MGKERDVRHHFLIGEFVPLRALYDTVQYEDFAVIGGFEYENVLKLGGCVVEDARYLEGEGLAWPEGAAFVEPVVDDEVGVVGGWGEGGHGF